MWIILGLFVGHWMVACFFQSSFHHRYASHRMFTMSRRAEKVWHLLAYAAQGSSYLSPRAYAILHREHHAYSDTEQDPHAPGFFSNAASMMWQTASRYSSHLTRRSTVESRFLGHYPDWPGLERLASTWTSRIIWGTIYGVPYLIFATSWWHYVLLPVQWLMGPVHGAIVNWCGHKYGYRNVGTRDRSRNTLPLDFVTLGELFQNNHHAFSRSLNFACRWWEFDPTYVVLRGLAWMRLIQLVPGSVGAGA